MLVSGMIIGTIFTLFVVPSIYMLVARKRTAVAEEPAIANAGAPELVEAVRRRAFGALASRRAVAGVGPAKADV